MSTHQMHAAVLHAVGQTPRYELFPAPSAGDGEAVVTVTAAALKPSDRWMANGFQHVQSDNSKRRASRTTAAGTGSAGFPRVAGLDGVGRLEDGTRVGFFGPQPPYGGMAEQSLVRAGAWLPVPDGVDDVTAAAFLNPGGAAWKTLMVEGELAAGERVLILGATGASGRIAAQLAHGAGARVVVAGRNQRVLDRLVERGAETAVRVDRPRDELAAAIAAAGPYDLVVDYLWGPPAEAAFAALERGGPGGRIRYVLVGMTAGPEAALPAMALRRARVLLFGSGIGGEAPLAEAAAAYDRVLALAAAGQITLDVDAVPLVDVEKAWPAAGSDRRVVFVP
jgi:NADPH:quinone reductase-like Zn-dependent oxidoreductase